MLTTLQLSSTEYSCPKWADSRMPPCRLPPLPLYSLPQYLTFVRLNYWAVRLSAFIAAVLPCSMIPDSLQLALVFVVDISTLFSFSMIPNFSLASLTTFFFYYSRYHSDLETTLFSHLFSRVNLPIFYLRGLLSLALTSTVLFLSSAAAMLHFSALPPCRLTFGPLS